MPNWKSLQTHCEKGHPFDEENTYIQPKSRKRCCRICQSVRNKANYDVDPDGAKAYFRENMRKWRAANKERERRNYLECRRKKKEWLDTQKIACVFCGISDPDCLDFHHKDPKTKDMVLAKAVTIWSVGKLKLEIAKCEVVCANCHRKLHAKEQRAGRILLPDLPRRMASSLIIEGE